MANNTNSCADSEPFALQVLGDSMEPEFPADCVVLIEPADDAAHGMYVMAMVEGVRWLRQYLHDAAGERLVAHNDIYPEIDLAGLDWKVEGIVTQRNLRRSQTPDGKRHIKHYDYQ